MEAHTESSMATMKVYELAKELGVDSISLVDKLAGLNIKVKNHMSDLAEAEIQTARESLGKGAKKEEPAAKKTAAKSVTRRKKTDEGTADSVSATAAPKTKKAATKTAATKSASATAAAPAAEAPSAKEGSAGSSPIIRRRVKTDETGESTSQQTVVMKRSGASDAEAKPVTTPAAKAAALAHSVGAEPDPEPIVAPEPEMPETPVEAAEAQAQASEEAPVEAQEPQAPAAPVSESTTPGLPGRITIGARPTPARKSFLTIVEHAPVTKPRILAPAPAVKPSTGGSPGIITRAGAGGIKGVTSATDKEGFRIVRMTKENLDQMAEEENAKKKGGGGIGERGEIKPEDVRFADYRKKEVVFMPKKKRTPVGKELKRTEKTVAAAHKRVVEMGDTISVSEFASQMNAKATDVIRKLMGMGQMVTVNQSIDFDTASLVAQEFNFEVKNVAFKEEQVLDDASDKPEDLMPRPPVVTIMGHVDHGKTSLLDAIRSAKVAAGEAGGITQHIGAYSVEKNGKLISFIDTPGHEAFTAMRARGANVTDIVILVVAADDGVMPQTREALSHAKAAGVPIIVAMNKMDKPGANPEKIKQQLAELDLLAEDWGGQSQFVPVSAAKKTGIDELLEAILLNAEVLDLKANPKTAATGTVLEARLEKGRGPVASVLVKRGTLRIGDTVVSGMFSGRVKSLMNDKGGIVKECLPGMPVEILGFEGLPLAGEKFDVVKDESAAQELISHRKAKLLAEKQAAQKISLDDLFAKVQAGATKELNIILKADVSGSVEAIRDSLTKLATEKVKVKVLFAAPGGITETDVMLANASKAIILGFNVRPETTARRVAEAEHVEIKTYQIIYELIDDVKLAMTGMLDKKKVERFLGRAEVRQTFSVPKQGTIAGCAVIDGKIVRGANVRLLRDSRVIFDGKLSSLKRFKDDAKEVAEGYECGMGIENYNDIKVGDLIEAYQIDLVTPDLH